MTDSSRNRRKSPTTDVSHLTRIGRADRFNLLVTRATQGDTRALRALINETAHRTWAAAVRHVADPDAAAAVVTATYATAMARLTSLKDHGELLRWLAKLARNAAADWLKRHKPRPALGATASAAAPVTISPATAFAVAQSVKLKHREILLMRHLQHLPVDEIAETLETTPDAVDSLLRKGRLALVKQLRRIAPRGSDEGALLGATLMTLETAGPLPIPSDLGERVATQLLGTD